MGADADRLPARTFGKWSSKMPSASLFHAARTASLTQTAPAPHPLTDREFATVQAHCARAINDLLRMDLTVHVEHDFHAFARYRRSVGDGLCNASFDPACCRINRADFWLRVVD